MSLEVVSEVVSTELSLNRPAPIGLEVQARDVPANLDALPVSQLRRWIDLHGVLILRGFSILESESDFTAFCGSWGRLLETDSTGVRSTSPSEARFRWTGAGHPVPPSFEFIQCFSAPETGGETVFCDTSLIWQMAAGESRREWQSISVTYANGPSPTRAFQASLVQKHPRLGCPTLRFAEPDDTRTRVLRVHGTPHVAARRAIDDLRGRLYRSAYTYAHQWHAGDLLIVDCHRTLQAKMAFDARETLGLRYGHVR